MTKIQDYNTFDVIFDSLKLKKWEIKKFDL